MKNRASAAGCERRVYLDFKASTPLAPQVVAAMTALFEDGYVANRLHKVLR